MQNKESVITSKGQMTIPKTIRDELHLESGSRITFVKNKDGYYELRPKTIDVKSLKGYMTRFKSVDKPATLEEMDEAIASGAIDGAGLDD
jgi:AbrB family looped-hinge helix DNA binding protein